MPLDITTTVSIGKTEFGDILTTALEGGSNDWYLIKDSVPRQEGEYLCDAIARHIYDNPDFKLDIYDLENPGEKLGTLSRKSVLDAFALLIKDHPETYASLIEESYDAGDADILFQLAVMGEVVYG